MNDAQILDLIEQKINDLPKNGVVLKLDRDQVRRSGRWLYAQVRSEPQDITASKYTALVSEIEEQVEKVANTNVLLVPALVD